MDADIPIKRKFLTGYRKRQLNVFLFTLPFIVISFLFSYLPLFGWYFAFIDYRPSVPVLRSAFVGLKYFRLIFVTRRDLMLAMGNTLALSFIGLGMSVVPPILAIMFSQIPFKKFVKITQSLSAIPNFISWVLVYAIMYAIFMDRSGLVNTLMMRWGLIESPVNIFNNPDTAWMVQTLLGLWKSVGWGAIIYLAQISGIDQELYQAAAIDGAGPFQRIIHVTVPGLWNIYFVMLLFAISGITSVGFQQYWLFGNGFTWSKLEVFDTYVYRLGMEKGQYSFASAIGILNSLVSLSLLWVANMVSKRVRGYTMF